jgi:hypothetical protein
MVSNFEGEGGTSYRYFSIKEIFQGIYFSMCGFDRENLCRSLPKKIAEVAR